MPDLNDLMGNVQKKSSEVKKQMQELLTEYEELYRQSNNRFRRERIEIGSMEGLDDFHRLVQIIKRNRDVISSVFRGINNMRSMEKYSFVEEDYSSPPPPKPAPRRRKARQTPNKKTSDINEQNLEQLKISSEESESDG